MGPLRIAFFGTGGDSSFPALRALAGDRRVVAIVRPQGRPASPLRRMLRRLRPDPLAAFARERHIPFCEAASRDDGAVRALLERTRPDLICIAGYRWVLPPSVLALAPLGALNLHAALLPRHRGILPLFWIYHGQDADTGVTVHWATATADAGDIVGQTAFPLARGLPVVELNRRNGEEGAALLDTCVRQVEAGTAPRIAQDERLATDAPRVRPGTPMARFDQWDVEQAWHFLAGLHPWFVEPLRAEDGTAIRYRGVAGFERTAHDRAPGRVRATPGSWLLDCRGGVIRLVA